MSNLDELRERIRAYYTFTPDDSHGEGHRNSGVVIALKVIERAAGRSFEGMCQPDADIYSARDVWCLTHGGPMPQRVLWCDFAARPWEWREQAIVDRTSARSALSTAAESEARG